MTIEEVRQRLAEIEQLAMKSDEYAHMDEDQLFVDFITSVAESESPHAAIARELLKSRTIKFERWYA